MEQVQGVIRTVHRAVHDGHHADAGRISGRYFQQRSEARAVLLRRGRKIELPAGKFRLDILGGHPLWPVEYGPAIFIEQGPYATAVISQRFSSLNFRLAPLRRYAKHSEGDHHAILDFSAGKDVGLGAFGSDGTSTISAGVRFARILIQIRCSTSSRVPSFTRIRRAIGGFRYEFTFYNYTMAAHAERELPRRRSIHFVECVGSACGQQGRQASLRSIGASMARCYLAARKQS